MSPKGAAISGLERLRLARSHLAAHPAVRRLDLLDLRHDELGARAHVGEIDVGVVLLEQPHRQTRVALGDRPQRVAATNDVDLGAEDAMRGEVARLQRCDGTRGACARTRRD